VGNQKQKKKRNIMNIVQSVEDRLTAESTNNITTLDGDEIAEILGGIVEAENSFNGWFQVVLPCGRIVETFGCFQHCESNSYIAIRLPNGRLVVTSQAGRGYDAYCGTAYILRDFGPGCKAEARW
jgi:hypothetical protein